MFRGELISREQATFQVLRPQYIEGLNAAANAESWSGNAGPSRAHVNAAYNGGRIVCGNDQEIGMFTDIGFTFRWPGRAFKAIKEGRIPPPPLIETVMVETAAARVHFDELEVRALQHNAALILDFIRKGGHPADLPVIPYMPNFHRLLLGEVVRVA